MPKTTTRFIITGGARTGSTMLRLALDSHEKVACHGEIWLGNGMGIVYKATNLSRGMDIKSLRNADPVAFLMNDIWGADKFPVVGVKIRYIQLFKHQRKVGKAIIKDRDVKVIHLYRDNLLERLVSFTLARQTGVYLIRNDDDTVVDTPRVNLPVETCLQDFQEQEEYFTRTQDVFKHHDVCNVQYEELTATPEDSYQRLYDFLGVEATPPEIDTVKVVKKSMKEIIGNYDELKDNLKDTKYSRFFD